MSTSTRAQERKSRFTSNSAVSKRNDHEMIRLLKDIKTQLRISNYLTIRDYNKNKHRLMDSLDLETLEKDFKDE